MLKNSLPKKNETIEVLPLLNLENNKTSENNQSNLSKNINATNNKTNNSNSQGLSPELKKFLYESSSGTYSNNLYGTSIQQIKIDECNINWNYKSHGSDWECLVNLFYL